MIIHCPDCNTKTELSEDRIEAAIQKHNDSQHDGKPVAGVGPDAVSLADYQTDSVDPLITHSMGEDAGPPSNHPDGVRGICKECKLVALFDHEGEAGDAVDTHNELEHNGTDTAGICAWDVPDLPSTEDILDAGGVEALAKLAQAQNR